MSDHSRALVPLATWSYNSPDARIAGWGVDVGLLAESLIYYDSVLIDAGNPDQFAEILQWFVAQHGFRDFLNLIRDGSIVVYDYSFMTTAVSKDGVWSLANIQDPIEAEAATFEQRYLYSPAVEQVLKRGRHRASLYTALRDRVVEVKAVEYGATVDNARDDFKDPRRCSLIIQAVVDALYAFNNKGRPPDVSVQVETAADGSLSKITSNVNFDALAELGGEALSFHAGQPLTACALCNRYLWSAAGMNCDLYLGQPMSVLVGDKLYESVGAPTRGEGIVTSLKEMVEFPDVRRMVNDGRLPLDLILSVRERAQRFRNWLQSETERDRDAIIAYHNEVAKEIGLIGLGRKSLRLFGFLGATLGGAIGGAITGADGGTSGALAGSIAGGFLGQLASRMNSGWRPVLFGDWMSDRIRRHIEHET